MQKPPYVGLWDFVGVFRSVTDMMTFRAKGAARGWHVTLIWPHSGPASLPNRPSAAPDRFLIRPPAASPGLAYWAARIAPCVLRAIYSLPKQFP